MLIFIDTEFTQFNDPELISIGLVTEDASHEFYAELPVDKKNAAISLSIKCCLASVKYPVCNANLLN